MNSNKNSALASRAEIEAQANWWFARLRSGDCSDSERAAHKVWLNSNLAHRKAYKELEDMWTLLGDFGERDEIRAIRDKALLELGLSNSDWDDDDDEDEDESIQPHSHGHSTGGSVTHLPLATHKPADLRADQKEAGQTSEDAAESLSAPPARSRRFSFSPARWVPMAVAASLLVVFLGLDFSTKSLWSKGVYQTAIGEQKTVSLNDGSLLILDTQTKVVTDFTASRRRITLEKGQARFDVAKDKERPFIVEAGPGKVTAIGTAFVVRKQNSDVLVTLLEGKVAVEQEDVKPPVESASKAREAKSTIDESRDSTGFDSNRPKKRAGGSRLLKLEAGQQVTYNDKGISTAEAANLDQATAWQDGRLVFEDDTLADVLKDLNRYSHSQILIGDKELETIRITGVFKTGDNKRIVETLKIYFSLRVTSDRYGNLILLSRRGGDEAAG